MSVRVREKRGRLYLDIYQGGKRTWESLHLALTHDKARNKEIYRVAEICRSKREIQLLTGAWDINDPDAGKIPLTAFAEEYSKSYKNPSVVKSCVKHIEGFGGGSIYLSQITPKWIDGFQNYLLKKETLSQSSAGYYSKILRLMLNKAVMNNMIAKNPASLVPNISIPETELIYLNIDELRQLAGVIPDDPYGREVRRAFLFSCYTGLRVSDLETITWARIETNPPQIIKRQSKTKNPVYIPLKKTAQEFIFDGKEHEPEEKIFSLSLHGRNASYAYLKRWVKQGNIKKKVGWHTARRTFATLALENGSDLYTVAKLLGHTDIRAAKKYAKVTDKLRHEAIEGLPEL
jgi:integrase